MKLSVLGTLLFALALTACSAARWGLLVDDPKYVAQYQVVYKFCIDYRDSLVENIPNDQDVLDDGFCSCFGHEMVFKFEEYGPEVTMDQKVKDMQDIAHSCKLFIEHLHKK